jgi:predicted membrane protein
MEIGAVVGSVKLDLRRAEIAAAVVDMHVRATLGSVKIWIPQGIAVSVDGRSVLGSRTIAESAAVPGAPLLRLHIDTVIGSVNVYRR